MDKEKCIEQLKDLKKHCEYQHQNGDEIWGEDVKALGYAIKELERTAQEVSPQEQLVNLNILIDKKELTTLIIKSINNFKNNENKNLLNI